MYTVLLTIDDTSSHLLGISCIIEKMTSRLSAEVCRRVGVSAGTELHCT